MAYSAPGPEHDQSMELQNLDSAGQSPVLSPARARMIPLHQVPVPARKTPSALVDYQLDSDESENEQEHMLVVTVDNKHSNQSRSHSHNHKNGVLYRADQSTEHLLDRTKLSDDADSECDLQFVTPTSYSQPAHSCCVRVNMLMHRMAQAVRTLCTNT